jgi:hypothetical protein
MKRQEKYPETSTFHYYNANPKSRITGDCRIRAICTACEAPYNQVVMDLAKIQCETGYDQCCNQGIDILMKQYGWEKCRQPRKLDNTKYTGKEFCKQIREGLYIDGKPLNRLVANIGGNHIVAIIDGKVWDIWDSTGGCIGNYWVKK